jgi:AAA+ ATPase superfamily predicted ATPase
VLLRKVLAGNPQMNLIFGATSVGKTALLRQVLASDDYYVIKFDLRISGFADLRTLYLALCEQFKNLFEEVIIYYFLAELYRTDYLVDA